MNNIPLFHAMIDRYNELSYTHNYIFGFAYKGVIYMTIVDSAVLPYVLKLDKASRGQGYAIRFSPTIKQKEFLLAYSQATPICSVKFFKETVNDSKYNNGEIFEKMVTEFFGQEWIKDNIPFTLDGDVTVNGIAYQIKFEKATFTNEKTLARL